MEDRKVYFGGYHYGHDSLLNRFIEKGIWEQGGEESDGVSAVPVGSIFFLKTTSTKKKTLFLTAAGLVTDNPQDGSTLIINWIYKPQDLEEVRIPNLAANYPSRFGEFNKEHHLLISEFFQPYRFEKLLNPEPTWELLYYWVNDERTDYGPGICLSNRFNIQLYWENGEPPSLSLTKNHDYIPNFFGHQVSNLSVIIGENGAGKTNLTYSIISKLTGYKHIYGYEYVLVFYNGVDKISIHESLTTNGDAKELRVKSSLPIRYDVIKSENGRGFYGQPHEVELLPEDSGLIYFNPIYDFRDYPYHFDTRNFSDVSSNYLLFNDNQYRNTGDYDMMALHRSQDIHRNINLLNLLQESLAVIDQINIPDRLEIEVLKTNNIEKSDLGWKARSLMELIRTYGSLTAGGVHNTNIDKSRDSESKLEMALKEKAITWLLINLFDHFFYCYADIKDLDDELLGLTSEDFVHFRGNNLNVEKSLDWPTIGVEQYREIVLDFFDRQKLLQDKEPNLIIKIRRLIEIVIAHAVVKEENEATFILPIEQGYEFLSICEEYASIFHNKYRKSITRVQWRNISSGELSLLNLFSRIHFGIENLNTENNQFTVPKSIFLIVDEGDHGLHPQWQKQFLDTLLSFLKSYEDIKFQIFIVSHSPIILSDIPKSHVVYLQKNTESLSQIRSDEHSETFGSNIHTLFRDTFFIRDGLIGSFAKKKIDELFERVSKAKSLDENEIDLLLKEIELIGEPILRKALQEKLYESRGYDELEEYYENQLKRIRNIRR